MRPTRARELIALAVLALGIGYAVTRLVYNDLPTLPRTAPLSVFVVALVEAQAAYVTRNRLAGRPGTRPILPLTVARLAALAKASSAAAATVAGLWAGALLYTAPRTDEIRTAGGDALTAALGVAAAVALLGAALALERVCRVRDGRR